MTDLHDAANGRTANDTALPGLSPSDKDRIYWASDYAHGLTVAQIARERGAPNASVRAFLRSGDPFARDARQDRAKRMEALRKARPIAARAERLCHDLAAMGFNSGDIGPLRRMIHWLRHGRAPVHGLLIIARREGERP